MNRQRVSRARKRRAPPRDPTRAQEPNRVFGAGRISPLNEPPDGLTPNGKGGVHRVVSSWTHADAALFGIFSLLF